MLVYQWLRILNHKLSQSYLKYHFPDSLLFPFYSTSLRIFFYMLEFVFLKASFLCVVYLYHLVLSRIDFPVSSYCFVLTSYVLRILLIFIMPITPKSRVHQIKQKLDEGCSVCEASYLLIIPKSTVGNIRKKYVITLQKDLSKDRIERSKKLSERNEPELVRGVVNCKFETAARNRIRRVPEYVRNVS